MLSLLPGWPGEIRYCSKFKLVNAKLDLHSLSDLIGEKRADPDKKHDTPNLFMHWNRWQSHIWFYLQNLQPHSLLVPWVVLLFAGLCLP